ncbi:MAG: glucose-1-phosphate thymidylyltransferase [Nitrospinaceae bacterium]|nr:glucose-1-phosphate thymidylyltransferase [Nitrospinaceae bacterium]NIR56593.1 glucose-1-phosphate thymidylyltransferase [Nitrospinaceae bacterium]NIS87055.1 glucose-1-phosphate thymidylyltransferase [Nitrospinaceae bacterium]NIT83899.1 glucose-1-phosphate thymidylyltransferase [Nitrospinaceae bacterium]NIU46102.1 glucose-1-phosphate thymidylyltransferase [Nitrospinaceae bacterium]
MFEGIETPWQPLAALEFAVAEAVDNLLDVQRVTSLDGLMFSRNDKLSRCSEPAVYAGRWVEIEEPVILDPLDIFLDKGTVLEPSAIVKGPAYIGKSCEIRQGAYLRGNILIGDYCVLGHNTEIKNSILMNHTEAGHFNYIGDSILGSYCNLGAGTRLANLEFRSPENKRKIHFPPLKMVVEGEEIEIGRSKFGAVIGDYAEIGCNAVLSPAVLMGKESWVYPNYTVPKGYYPPQTRLVPADRKIRPGNS